MPKHVCLEEFMTEEEKKLRDAVRSFVEGVVMPVRQQVDADEREHKLVESIYQLLEKTRHPGVVLDVRVHHKLLNFET